MFRNKDIISISLLQYDELNFAKIKILKLTFFNFNIF